MYRASPKPRPFILLERSVEDENGCRLLATQKRPKTRFRGRQVASARLVYCVVNRAVLTERTVIRHRCHNERCVNPSHLVEGSAADNKRDDWDFWANGVDYNLL
ncbi:hypothetical protein FTO60_03220 [Octadecabacter sp. SW4]|nr:hypothetical protein FTO60_03220 [Octadecabacter sp. SW4]